MKMLIYSHSGDFYGAENSIFELAKGLKKLGQDVLFVVPETGVFSEKLNKHHIEYIISFHPKWTIRKQKKISLYLLFRKRANFLKCLLVAFYKNKKIVRRFNPDIIVTNTSVSPTSILISKFLNIRNIVFLRETLYNNNQRNFTIFPKFITQKILTWPAIKIVPSRFLKNYLNDILPLGDLNVLGNPIQIPKITNEKSFIQNDVWIIGLVGFFTESKGQPEIINEFIKYSIASFKLCIIGNIEPTYESWVKTLMKDYPDKIFFHNYIKNKGEIYSKFDILINNSKDETFGRTVIEAMAYGKLVMGLDSGAIREIINNEVNGILFKSADKIFPLLIELKREENHQILNGMIENAKNYVIKYNKDGIAKKFLKLANAK